MVQICFSHFHPSCKQLEVGWFVIKPSEVSVSLLALIGDDSEELIQEVNYVY